MANQSCFITAIAFLKFEFLAPVQRLAGFAPAQTEAVQSGVGVAVRNLQHCINATTLLLYLLLLTIVCGRFRRTPRLTGLALPIIGSVLNTGVSGCWDVSDCPL
jgi:hypothetical protein